jgi:hypothetical protein
MKFIDIGSAQYLNIDTIRHVKFTSAETVISPPMPDGPRTKELVSADITFRSSEGGATLRIEGQGAKNLRSMIQAAH